MQTIPEEIVRDTINKTIAGAFGVWYAHFGRMLPTSVNGKPTVADMRRFLSYVESVIKDHVQGGNK